MIRQLISFGHDCWLKDLSQGQQGSELMNWRKGVTNMKAITKGTGGVWRIAAINEAGGWKDRTTVEDMDLAVRAGLKGWKFVYLGDLQVCFTEIQKVVRWSFSSLMELHSQVSCFRYMKCTKTKVNNTVCFLHYLIFKC